MGPSFYEHISLFTCPVLTVTMYVYFAPWLIPERSGVSRLSFVRTTISVVSRLAYGVGQDL